MEAYGFAGGGSLPKTQWPFVIRGVAQPGGDSAEKTGVRGVRVVALTAIYLPTQA